MQRGVDLTAPGDGSLVQARQTADPRVLVKLERDQQVVLGIADQVLHDEAPQV